MIDELERLIKLSLVCTLISCADRPNVKIEPVDNALCAHQCVARMVPKFNSESSGFLGGADADSGFKGASDLFKEITKHCEKSFENIKCCACERVCNHRFLNSNCVFTCVNMYRDFDICSKI